MLKIPSFTILFLTFAVQIQAAALIGPAFSKWSSSGMSVDAGKQGINTMQVIGAMLSKPGGKPTMTISKSPVLIKSASSAAIEVDIAQYTDVTVCKSDATTHTVTITDSTARTIPLDPLSIQGACATLTLSSTGTWFVK